MFKLPLRGKYAKGKSTLVDEDIFNELKNKAIYINHLGDVHFFIYANGGRTTHILGRYIIKTPKGMDTDHINRDKLDNRRCNLRICTHSENMRNRVKLRTNSTGYKGVYYHKKNKKYFASVSINNKNLYFGWYETAKQAAIKYNKINKRLFPDFAYLNEIK